jgi:hypothetical protein
MPWPVTAWFSSTAYRIVLPGRKPAVSDSLLKSARQHRPPAVNTGWHGLIPLAMSHPMKPRTASLWCREKPFTSWRASAAQHHSRDEHGCLKRQAVCQLRRRLWHRVSSLAPEAWKVILRVLLRRSCCWSNSCKQSFVGNGQGARRGALCPNAAQQKARQAQMLSSLPALPGCVTGRCGGGRVSAFGASSCCGVWSKAARWPS